MLTARLVYRLARGLASDSLKLLVALMLFLILFFSLGPPPDLPPGMGERIMAQYAIALAPTDRAHIGATLRQALQVCRFWFLQAGRGLGRPLRAFYDAQTSNLAILWPAFLVTAGLSLGGGLLGLLGALTMSVRVVNRQWRAALNGPSRRSTWGLQAVLFFSNLPAFMTGLVALFVLAAIGAYNHAWVKFAAGMAIIGYADSVLSILSGYFIATLQAQYARDYIGLSAARGAANLALSAQPRACLAGKALANSLPALIHAFRQKLSLIIGMTVVLEILFNIHGLGLKSWQLLVAEANGDFMQLGAILCLYGLIWVLMNGGCRLVLPDSRALPGR